MRKIVLLLAVFGLFACQVHAEKKEKTQYRNALIFAYSQANSVFEDDNIKLEIYNETLWATNKTSKTIFIALDQSFMIHNGSATPLYDSSKKEQGDKKASKKGVTSEETVMVTLAPKISENQAPTDIRILSPYICGNYSTSETPTGSFTEYDKRLFYAIEQLTTEAKRKEDKKDDIFTGSATMHFTEDESVLNIGCSIAYSFNKKAEEWTNVTISTWISDLIFAPYYNELPKELSNKEKKGFGVKESPYAYTHIKAKYPYEEFNEGKACAIVCDWKGDFKKGTFELGHTWAAKKGSKTAKFFGALLTGGLTLLAPSEVWDKYYKSRLKFDGSNADWGKMTYANSIADTGKENKGQNNDDDDQSEE